MVEINRLGIINEKICMLLSISKIAKIISEGNSFWMAIAAIPPSLIIMFPGVIEKIEIRFPMLIIADEVDIGSVNKLKLFANNNIENASM